jgi:hypothetical protein
MWCQRKGCMRMVSRCGMFFGRKEKKKMMKVVWV